MGGNVRRECCTAEYVILRMGVGAQEKTVSQASVVVQCHTYENGAQTKVARRDQGLRIAQSGHHAHRSKIAFIAATGDAIHPATRPGAGGARAAVTTAAIATMVSLGRAMGRPGMPARAVAMGLGHGMVTAIVMSAATAVASAARFGKSG